MTFTQSKLVTQESTEACDPDKNIWSDILQEVQNSTKKTPPPKSVVLLGDNESGRSTLIARMKGLDSISKGIGLEYHYIEVNNEEDRDDTQKLGVWIPDGDVTSPGLLRFALNESSFENTMVAFVVSMGTPWTIMDSLKKWSHILREHVNKLNIPDAKREEYARQQCRQFQSYLDPDEKQQTLASGTKLAAAKETTASDEFLLPLDPEILSKNLGLPIMVIVTKSDSISLLEKENEFRIEHFDFIQHHIRRFCLNYGASLVYTTIKDKRTYEKLLKYMTHKMFNFSFNIPSSVVDRESVFIPSGWDNEAKINILLENSSTLNSGSDYAEVISKPSSRKPTQRGDLETVLATEDQEFLSKLQLQLNKSSSASVKPEEISPSQASGPARMIDQPNRIPNKPPQPTDSTNLKNFFQNLLNKNAPSSNVAAATSPAGVVKQEPEIKQEPGNESNA